jgi:hypothetical protein
LCIEKTKEYISSFRIPLSSCEYALFLYEEEIFFLKEKSVLVKGMANINISLPQVWAPALIDAHKKQLPEFVRSLSFQQELIGLNRVPRV